MRVGHTRHYRTTAHSTERLYTAVCLKQDHTLHSTRCLRVQRRRSPRHTKCTTAEQESFYSILGVEHDATLAEITSAYRRSASTYSKFKDSHKEAASQYQAIQDAYKVLSNDNSRRLYNLYGVTSDRGQNSKYSSSTGQADQYKHATKGANVSAAIRLSFLEAALGAERDFTASARSQCTSCSGSGISADVQPENCTSCSGSGQILRFKQTPAGRVRQLGTCPACGGKGVQSRYWCLNCGGDGRALTSRKLRVKIPPGVGEASMLRLNGQGDVGLFGGARGDLLLKFLIDDEESFTRKGYDVYSTVPITYVDAVLGSHVQVQTVQGPMAVKVPAGTQHGTILKLRDQGVQGWGPASSKFGCHYLTLHLVLPTTCQQAEQHLLEQLSLLSRS